MNELEIHALSEIPLQGLVKQEYRIYQIYTLMDRAIPYLVDGLKPSQRRILYTLWKNRSKGLLKVSSTTGLVLTLHPHGPQSVESTIVNLAQDFTFSNNYPLIDKKGYFGERMEPSPAASRYIECKLGEVAELLLFDDMNQVEMIPNYDEREVEPLFLQPKLPLMLLNGAEGIGTGFSSSIPAFNHKDIIKSMISYVESGKATKIKPWYRNFDQKLEIEKTGKVLFHSRIEEKKDKVLITELPKGYDSQKIYRYLGKHIESGFLKDFIDNSVENKIEIELIFKRGQKPSLEEVQKTLAFKSSLSPNYTLISENGVRIYQKVNEIIALFTEQRLEVVKKRYELLVEDFKDRIKKNNELIRFIKEKHYEQATKVLNRKAFVDYLQTKKFHYKDFLADLPIYRMTKEEVKKKKLLVADEKSKLSEFEKIAKSKAKIKKKLIEELKYVSERLTEIMAKKEARKTKAKKNKKNK